MATALVSRKLVALGINIGFGARKKLNKLKKNVTAYFLFIYFFDNFYFLFSVGAHNTLISLLPASGVVVCDWTD